MSLEGFVLSERRQAHKGSLICSHFVWNLKSIELIQGCLPRALKLGYGSRVWEDEGLKGTVSVKKE